MKGLQFLFIRKLAGHYFIPWSSCPRPTPARLPYLSGCRPLPWIFLILQLQNCIMPTQQNAQILWWGSWVNTFVSIQLLQTYPVKSALVEARGTTAFFLLIKIALITWMHWENLRQSWVAGKAVEHDGEIVRLSTPSLGAALGLSAPIRMRTFITAVASYGCENDTTFGRCPVLYSISTQQMLAFITVLNHHWHPWSLTLVDNLLLRSLCWEQIQ